MADSDLLQFQREQLRQFRQATAERVEAEQATVRLRDDDLAAARAAQQTAQQVANELRAKADHYYQEGQAELERAGLQTLLRPGRATSAAARAAARAHPDDEPGKRLAAVVAEAEQSLERLRDKVTALKRWERRRRDQTAVLASMGILVLCALAVVTLLSYQAWERDRPYREAMAAYKDGDWPEAVRLFEALGNTKDSQALAKESRYQLAVATFEAGEWAEARRLFSELEGYKDSQAQARESAYQLAAATFEAGEWAEARRLFSELEGYKDSQTLAKESTYQLAAATYEAHEWAEARRLFDELEGYKDSQALAKDSTYQLAASGGWAEAAASDEQNQELLFAACPPPTNATNGITWSRCSDGMVMVFVPSGSFLMGSMAEDTEALYNEFPQHEVHLVNFWLDRTEVTNAQYNQCVTASVCAASEPLNDHFSDETPVQGINWLDADVYCRWVGGQLPTEAQWEYAARGPDGRRFPWGDSPPDGSLANFDRNVGTTTPVGHYPAGASWVGALDMAGNVQEWVADWYDSDYYSSSPHDNPTGPVSGNFKVLRGGSWGGGARYVRGAYRYNVGALVRSHYVGFRCLVPQVN